MPSMNGTIVEAFPGVDDVGPAPEKGVDVLLNLYRMDLVDGILMEREWRDLINRLMPRYLSLALSYWPLHPYKVSRSNNPQVDDKR